jgi:tetratricopeptide (TPR) repeat protein
MFPETAITDRGTTHNQLGNIYQDADDIDHALCHYRHAIRYKEQIGDLFGAGQTRYNAALALFRADLFDDARAYAEAALANFQAFGELAADLVQRTERLIVDIAKNLAEKRTNT